MEMRYFWTQDQTANKTHAVTWQPGQENLADCFTKHHLGAHHQKVRPYYLWQKNSPRFLIRALPPSVMRGCAKTGMRTHQSRAPLPRVTQQTGTVSTCATTDMTHSEVRQRNKQVKPAIMSQLCTDDLTT